jgi:LAO/AO transport system kinase
MEEIRQLADSARAGDRRALARILSITEAGGPPAEEAVHLLHPHSGKSHIIGLTGAPGTGKSTLLAALARVLRKGGYSTPQEGEVEPSRSVAVIAVDPSSPFSGGALLGDRIRMRDLAGDPGVFIRSMASRGALGGLARAVEGALLILDAVGFDVIFVETVGAGQAEVEIARHAHTVLVVDAPGLGDDIQALKAGILEIADILVLNKGDLPGAEESARALREMLEMGGAREGGWLPRVFTTMAKRGEGIMELAVEISRHGEHLRRSGIWQTREEARVRRELESRLRDGLMDQWRENAPVGQLDEFVYQVMAREISPDQAVRKLLRKDSPPLPSDQ